MLEFHSHLEKIMAAEELRFDPTPAFGQYNSFLKQALPHPAKANTKLLKFLIEHFTKEGDTILDPMCGSGSTGIVAAVHARNAVQIDIEEKFIKWAEEAKAKVERQAVFSKKGKITNVCGDARRLSELLKEVDVVLTSPPYSKTLNESKNTTSNLKRAERLKTAGHEPKNFFGGSARNCQLEDGLRYSHDSSNIGNLPHGEVDAVITSPPYEGSLEGGSRHTKGGIASRDPALAQTVGYSPDKENIGNLKKETYLEAMFKCYQEMWKVLKSNGLCIIIIKPFIRNRTVVDLPWHTWLLLEKVGFKLAKLYKLRLKNPSFWRILYTKKYPEVPEIKHEYVLVCQK